MTVELLGRGNDPMRKFDKITASDVRYALAIHYAQPEWSIFFEVADGTGMSKTRSADCVAMNMYTSRGLAIHGIEIKVSRSDLARELREADKAEAVARHCDKWWIAAPKGMVDPDELPVAWGLIEVWCDGDNWFTRIKKQAQTLPSPPLTRVFMASMLRSSSKVQGDVIERRVASRVQTLQTEFNVELARVHERNRKHGDEAGRFLADFKREHGIDLMKYNWDKEALADMIKISESGLLSSWGGLKGVINSLEHAIKAAKAIDSKLGGGG